MDKYYFKIGVESLKKLYHLFWFLNRGKKASPFHLVIQHQIKFYMSLFMPCLCLIELDGGLNR